MTETTAAARDTSSYTRIELPKAGPAEMLPHQINKKTGQLREPGRFALYYTHRSSSENQATCDYYWNGN